MPKHQPRPMACAIGSRAAMNAPARRHLTKFEAPLTVAALLTFRSVSSVLLIWRLVNHCWMSSKGISWGSPRRCLMLRSL